jgi:hypothetical protein
MTIDATGDQIDGRAASIQLRQRELVNVWQKVFFTK